MLSCLIPALRTCLILHKHTPSRCLRSSSDTFSHSERKACHSDQTIFCLLGLRYLEFAAFQFERQRTSGHFPRVLSKTSPSVALSLTCCIVCSSCTFENSFYLCKCSLVWNYLFNEQAESVQTCRKLSWVNWPCSGTTDIVTDVNSYVSINQFMKTRLQPSYTTLFTVNLHNNVPEQIYTIQLFNQIKQA